MQDNQLFERLKGYVNQLEQITHEQSHTSFSNREAQTIQTTKEPDEYDDLIEQEFIKDDIGQSFAKRQLEEAMKYMAMCYMETPPGKKLAEERAVALKTFRDSKLKEFFENQKKAKGAENNGE